jgi:hypothetical protein
MLNIQDVSYCKIRPCKVSPNTFTIKEYHNVTFFKLYKQNNILYWYDIQQKLVFEITRIEFSTDTIYIIGEHMERFCSKLINCNFKFMYQFKQCLLCLNI